MVDSGRRQWRPAQHQQQQQQQQHIWVDLVIYSSHSVYLTHHIAHSVNKCQQLVVNAMS